MNGRATRFFSFVVIVAFAAGCCAYVRATRSVFPAISLARVEVFVDAGNMAPEDLLGSVGHPLETAFGTLPGVRATRAYVDAGKLEIELDFDTRLSATDDLRNVDATLAGVRDRLPIVRTTTLIEGPEMEPVVTYALRAKSATQAALRKAVEEALPAVFTGTPGLARVTVFGGPREGFAVDLDAKKLAARGISVTDVLDAVGAASRPSTAGTLVRGEERFLVDPSEHVASFDGVRAIALPDRRRHESVTLAALGTVRVRDEPTDQQASFDGTHAIVVNAYPATNADAVALAGAVAARMPSLLERLPRDTENTIAWDQTRLIVASQDGLRDEIALGAVLALAVIYLFLRNGAMTLAAALVVPVAIVASVALLWGAGLSLNLMTLGGLAIAVGLVIDETIVVIEAIAREIGSAPSGEEPLAIVRAVRAIARPLVAATAANVVVFLPLAFVSGIPGFFFRALAITLAVALIVSIALSLGWAPAIARALLTRMARPHDRSLVLERGYVRLLRWSGTKSRFVFAAGVVIFVAGTFMLIHLPTSFLPEIDEGEFEIKYALPAGMSLDAADALASKLEIAILADPAVAHETRLSGVDTNGYVATPPDAGTIRVVVKAGSPHFDKVADRLRLAIASINQNIAVEMHQLLEDQMNDLSGVPEALQLTIHGPRQSELQRLASAIADDISDVRGVVDSSDGVVYEARSIAATPRSSDDGASFANDVRARAGGIVAADVAVGASTFPIVVRVVDGSALERTAKLDAPQLVTQIQEENGERIERVTAGIENADLSTVIASVRHQITHYLNHPPKGYSVQLGGAVDSQRAAFDEFALVLGIAVVLVFGVLVATFDSFRLPLVILAAIPPAPIGVALSLYVTHTPINVSSFMGMLLLVGIVVRNGILLIESANRRRFAGESNDEALEHAALERLRPILMTTFAALGALLPLAIGIGSGSEMSRPLAVAVTGGLITSTALTLVFIPTLYSAVVKRSRHEYPTQTRLR